MFKISNHISPKYLLVMLISLFMLTGCETAVWSDFKPVPQQANVYTLTVYAGTIGVIDNNSVNVAAEKKAKEFMIQHHYKSYRILGKEYHVLFSNYTVTVRFYNKLVRGALS